MCHMVNPNGSLEIYIQQDEPSGKNQIGCLHPMEIFMSSSECIYQVPGIKWNLPNPTSAESNVAKK